MSKSSKLANIFKYILLILFGLISVFPFYWMAIGATNPSHKLFSKPITLLPGADFIRNLTNLNENINIYRVLFNSLLVSCVYVLLALAVCTMAAYVLAKFKFRGANTIFVLFLLSMMIPYQALVIPQFKMMLSFDLLNTYFALIAPQICYPFAIFLMRQNFLAFPDQLLESARLDGAGEGRIFIQIVLPTMKPALAATSIFLFMFQWNNFMWPLVVETSSDMYTFPVALSSLTGVSFTDYGQVMTGITFATIPIILFFLVLQKQFISGMLGGAIKK